MSKEENSKQTSWSEVFPASRSVSQENKKGEMTTDISGQKCLDSLKKSNPSSLLGRMCKDLLTSKTAWSSDRCKMTWKVKVSKSNVSLYQLQASVLGTKGFRVWIVGHSKHNGLLASRARCNEGKRIDEGGHQYLQEVYQNKCKRGANKGHERSNGYGNDEDVSNTESIGTGGCRD